MVTVTVSPSIAGLGSAVTVPLFSGVTLTVIAYVGANVAEGVRGQSKADFYAKMNIALKEGSETSFWLDILHETDYLPDSKFNDLNKKCEELISILVAILKNR